MVRPAEFFANAVFVLYGLGKFQIVIERMDSAFRINSKLIYFMEACFLDEWAKFIVLSPKSKFLGEKERNLTGA